MMNLSSLILSSSLALLALQSAFAFTTKSPTRVSFINRSRSLFMGRAAAVRAVTKARTDAAKAKNNNRFAKKIIMAVKAGGSDAAVNTQLAQVIYDAKAANVPKDVIDRNIAKASQAATDDYKEGLFEFYGHGGVGMLVNVLTDNDNRAAAEINLVAKKNYLKSAATNSVAFKFNKKAKIDLNKVIDEDTLMEMCLELDVDDYDLRTEVNGSPINPSDDGTCVILVDQKDMAGLRDALIAKEYEVQTRLAAVPMEGFMSLSEEDYELNIAALDAFLALDDVDSVEHNIDLAIVDDE